MSTEDENSHRLSANEAFRTKKIIAKNFVGGVAWGVGSVVGATIIITLLVMIANFINFIPIIGDFITQVVEYVEARKFPLN